MKLKVKAMTVAVVATAIASAGSAMAVDIEYNLSLPGNQLLDITGANGGYGGPAKVGDFFMQPTGTGVFEPFLTIDANGQTSTGDKNIEQGYNTAGGAGQSNLYLDQLRPQWNNLVTIGDLAKIDLNGTAYYAFILDANEPGNGNSLISIDNVRIYTSDKDNTGAIQDDLTKLDNLGTKRWALNDPTKAGDNFNIENWIKLDANQENVEQGSNQSNGGSGKGDMILYVPVDAFAGSKDSDYLWFYNLNGVHYKSDSALGSTSGYEEWRAVTGPRTTVPDGGATVALLGLGLVGLAAIRRKS